MTKALASRRGGRDCRRPPRVALGRGADGPGFEAADLAPYAAARGIPEPVSAIRFASITGSEAPSPDLQFPQLPTLRQAQVASIVESWLPLGWDEFRSAKAKQKIPDHLDAEAKLAGSTLFHFGAFLSTTWRSNDWWWGRLDAAAGILRFIDSLPKPDPDVGVDPARRRRRGAEGGARPSASPSTAPCPPTIPARRAPTCRPEPTPSATCVPATSSPSRRAASASSRAGSAAAGGRRRPPPGSLVPPLLAAAPLIAHPIRAVAGIAVVLAALAAAASPVYGLWRLLGLEDRIPDGRARRVVLVLLLVLGGARGARLRRQSAPGRSSGGSRARTAGEALGDLADGLSDRRGRARSAAIALRDPRCRPRRRDRVRGLLRPGPLGARLDGPVRRDRSELVAMRMAYRLPDAIHHKGSRALWIVVASAAALLADAPRVHASGPRCTGAQRQPVLRRAGLGRGQGPLRVRRSRSCCSERVRGVRRPARVRARMGMARRGVDRKVAGTRAGDHGAASRRWLGGRRRAHHRGGRRFLAGGCRSSPSRATTPSSRTRSR